MMISKGLKSSPFSVSVLIPVYNQHPAYFTQAVDSALESLSNNTIELVVCDDGSDLDLSELYKNVCEERDIQFFRLHRNFGMNVARNLAALRSSGEYLLLLDSDDVLAGNWSDFIGRVLENQPWIAFADHSQYDENLVARLQKRTKAPYQQVLEKYFGTLYDPFLHSTFLFHPQVYRRDKFFAAGGFDCTYSSGDEIALQLRILREGSICDVLHFSDELYKYRKNPNSVVHNKDTYAALIANIGLILEREYFTRHGLSVTVRWLGREASFGAAHYAVRDAMNNEQLLPPWFDFDQMCIVDRLN